jgi:hypothetical protein
MYQVRKMNIKSAMIVVFLAVSTLFAANAIAQPLPYETDPLSPWQNYPPEPGYPGTDYPLGPEYPGSQSGLDPYSSQSGQGGAESSHPTSGPQSYQPMSTPSASTTQALDYGQGETLTQQEVFASGGMQASGDMQMRAYAMVTGLQLWVRYNGAWSKDPAAVYYYRSTSMLTNNDQSQYIWSWERYPNGRQQWQNWGYRMPGYIHGQFIGDARGWHQLAMWGSRSGWSNVIWIYVW